MTDALEEHDTQVRQTRYQYTVVTLADRKREPEAQFESVDNLHKV